ncbi:MAG: efflux RND transporter periplasmic adaptor subunit [Planctomycetes bacterium]|jgi:cobalt-zinc-cadmium efflux system membrane fusion protein|nr:efflux RND transporter periplasmic adaptor subunit [Planctomycetota bacterium]
MRSKLIGTGAFLLALAVLGPGLAGCQKQPAHTEGDGHDHEHKRYSTPDSPAATAVTGQPALSGAKCAVHAAPKELCFLCDAALRDKGRLWCAEHHRYEDRCWLCHPEARDKNRLYCDEHGLYEDECFLCHPELQGTGKPVAASGAVLMCAEHGVAEAECGICRPEATRTLKPGESLKVRLPSPASTKIVGIRTASPQIGPTTEGVECFAEVSFNQNALAQIVAPVSGILQSVDVDLGSRVEEGQVVAKLWSASVAEAVARAVLTHQTLDRERKLSAGQVTSQAVLQEAEAAHNAACLPLRTLGFTEERIEEFSHRPQEQVLLEVRAPFAGEIVERTAVRGALVETGKPLFVLTDRAIMWAVLQVPETALAHVRAGQAVELRVDSLPDNVFPGQLTWIGPAVDAHTRMTLARAEFADAQGLLKDKMFARARILTRRNEKALLLPTAAVQYVAGRPLVFVQAAADLFDARAVQLGVQFEGHQEVLAGLGPQESVAVTHTFALKSALLMSRLGAGCADD